MKTAGKILFIIGVILTASMAFGQTPADTNAQKTQQWALAAVFLTIGAYLSWGKKKPN